MYVLFFSIHFTLRFGFDFKLEISPDAGCLIDYA